MRSFIILALLLFTAQSFAATYYVKLSGGTGTGLDSNSQAWSYTKLNATSIPSGSTVLLRSGETFTGQIMQYPNVIYGKYGANPNPVVSGFTPLTSWTLSSGNIYWTPLTFAQVQVVTLDGVMQGIGRYPNSGYLTYTSHSGNTSITGTSIGTLPTTYVGGEVVIKKYRYILDRHAITAQSGNTITYSNSTTYGNNNNYEPTDGNGYFIQGHLSTLDQLGEWYYDASNSRLYMHFGTGTPSGHTVKVATVQKLADENSVSGITVNNVDFEGGVYGIYHVGSTGTTFNNCNIRLCGTGVYGVDCSNITLNNTNVSDCGSNGFFLENNGSGITVNGGIYNHIGQIPGLAESGDARGSAIALAASNLVVQNTIVKNVGFNGIGFDGNNILVYHNFVDSFNTVKDDGGGIYTFGNSGVTYSNRIIRSNIVLHAIGNAEGAGNNGDPNGEAAHIYLDGFANHVTVDSNICAYGPWMSIFVNANPFNSVINNTTYDVPMGLAINQVAISGPGSVRNFVLTGNKFIARTASQSCIFINILSASDNPQSFSTTAANWNNNIYARPIDDNLTIQLARSYSGGNGLNNYSVATWKAAYPLDANSTKSAITTSSLSNIRFDYNATTSALPLTLTANYKDVLGTTYGGLQSINPYQGNVLVYYSDIIPSGSPIKVTPSGSVIITIDGRAKVSMQNSNQIP